MSFEKQDKLRNKELQRNPMGKYSDAVNRSLLGDPATLLKGGCLTKIITLLIIVLGSITLMYLLK